MANPQLKNGYTRIANELLEKVIGIPLIATQLKIILVCWRYTYGFSKKEAGLSESFIAKATGISKRYVSKELRVLIDSKILNVVKESTFTSPRIVSFNKNYDEWEYRTTVPQVNGTSTVELQCSTTVEQQFNTTVEPQFHQKRNLKENSKENIKPPINLFPDNSIEVACATYFTEQIRKNNPSFKEPNIQTWAKGFDLIIRLDGRSETDIRKVIDFCQSDDFWSCNVLSPAALRKQFDRLSMLANKSKCKGDKPSQSSIFEKARASVAAEGNLGGEKHE